MGACRRMLIWLDQLTNRQIVSRRNIPFALEYEVPILGELQRGINEQPMLYIYKKHNKDGSDANELVSTSE